MNDNINYRELTNALKIGVYKSMRQAGLISAEQLGKLLEEVVCNVGNN